MSGRNRQLVLTDNASQDLQKIQAFSMESWGEGQAADYDNAILRALATIQEHPNLGKARSDLGSEFRSFRVKSHNIY
jgi:toxin ParE1/3/4